MRNRNTFRIARRNTCLDVRECFATPFHRKPRKVFGGLAILGLGVLFFLSGTDLVASEPLDPESCRKLQSQKEAYLTLGVENYMAKGPAWALANLGDGELYLIKSYLQVLEQLRFRCPQPKVKKTSATKKPQDKARRSRGSAEIESTPPSSAQKATSKATGRKEKTRKPATNRKSSPRKKTGNSQQKVKKAEPKKSTTATTSPIVTDEFWNANR